MYFSKLPFFLSFTYDDAKATIFVSSHGGCKMFLDTQSLYDSSRLG